MIIVGEVAVEKLKAGILAAQWVSAAGLTAGG